MISPSSNKSESSLGRELDLSIVALVFLEEFPPLLTELFVRSSDKTAFELNGPEQVENSITEGMELLRFRDAVVGRFGDSRSKRCDNFRREKVLLPLEYCLALLQQLRRTLGRSSMKVHRSRFLILGMVIASIVEIGRF